MVMHVLGSLIRLELWDWMMSRAWRLVNAENEDLYFYCIVSAFTKRE